MDSIFDEVGHLVLPDGSRIWISMHPQGRMIHAKVDSGTEGESEPSLDYFNIGVSHENLARFLERSKKRVFTWQTRDKSLTVDGKNGHWKLRFVRQGPPGGSVLFDLDPQRVDALRGALWPDSVSQD